MKISDEIDFGNLDEAINASNSLLEIDNSEHVAAWSEKLSDSEKIIRTILRHTNKAKLPLLESLLPAVGTKTLISDIGIADNSCTKFGAMIRHLGLPLTSLTNAPLSKRVVIDVGASIIRSGRFFSPIHVAILEDGSKQCISGRHRLAFLALAYGINTKVPVILEKMSDREAKLAIALSNEHRPVSSVEKMDIEIIKYSKNQVSSLYKQLSSSRRTINKYCLYNLLNRQYPVALSFKLAKGVNEQRLANASATIAALELYLQNAIAWKKGMSQETFDRIFLDAVIFLNKVMSLAKTHNISATRSELATLGKYFEAIYAEVAMDVMKIVEDIVKEWKTKGLDLKSLMTLDGLWVIF